MEEEEKEEEEEEQKDKEGNRSCYGILSMK